MRMFFLLPLLLVARPLASQTIVTGTLLGNDGKPLSMAHIVVAGGSGEKPIATVEAGRDGGFTLEIAAAGAYRLTFAGVDHAATTVPLLLEEKGSRRVDVRLGTRRLPDTITSVRVIGDFNDFDFGTPREMTKYRDGTWRIDIPKVVKSLSYQVVFDGPEGTFSMNGTTAGGYAYDGAGDYRSILTPSDGVAHIVYDPRKAPTPGLEATVTWQDPVSAAWAETFLSIDDRQQRFYQGLRGWMKEGKSYARYRLAEPNISRIAERLRTADRQRAGALALDYLHAVATSGDGDTLLVRRALGLLPPLSPVWGLQPDLAIQVAGSFLDSDEKERFTWSMATEHPDPAARRGALSARIISASTAGETAILRRYYDRLIADFPDDRETRYIRMEHNPDRVIQKGRTIPSFSIADLEHPGRSLSDQSLRGKTVLIDFWATWCGPCVMEMPQLHEAWKKYGGRGDFDVVSLSFDESSEAIGPFREKRFPMPWQHAFVEGGFRSDLAKAFEVAGIPKPILVGPDGTILAVGSELRGEDLDATLDRVLNGTEVSSR